GVQTCALPISGRLPRSRSACRTQLRSVSPEQPIFAAIDWMAAHCDAYSRSCSNTSRTARSRTSGEYFFACLMTPISQELESPANPGRFSEHLEPLLELACVKAGLELDGFTGLDFDTPAGVGGWSGWSHGVGSFPGLEGSVRPALRRWRSR